MTKGWKFESSRHSLARKGIETGKKRKIKTSTPKILTKQDYYNIAVEEDLGYAHRDAYIKFMLKRFPHERDIHYAREWAQRFKKGIHWASADTKSKKILKEAYGLK